MSVTKLMGRTAALIIAAFLALTLSPVPQQAQAAGEAVSLQSASAIAPIGQTVTARAKINPVLAGQRGFIQVWINGGWQTRGTAATTNSKGEYTVTLPYGQNQVGAHLFRMGAVVQGRTVYSASFYVARHPRLISAQQSMVVGTMGSIRAQTNPGSTSVMQVSHNGRWTTVASARATSTGAVTLPYNYGAGSGGYYAFRIGTVARDAVGNTVTIYTNYWWVVRYLVTGHVPYSFAGGVRTNPYTSNGKWIGTPDGAVSMAYYYHGNMNGMRDWIIAANVQGARIPALNPYSFTNKRNYAGGVTCGTWLSSYKMCAIAKGNGFRLVQARFNAYNGLSDSMLVYFVKDLAARV